MMNKMSGGDGGIVIKPTFREDDWRADLNGVS
jgi:hypothetical protein